MTTAPLRLLLVDDDKDIVFLIHQLIADMKGWNFKPEWVNSFTRGHQVISQKRHEVYLIDYNLPDGKGTELIRAGIAAENPAPMVLITGMRSAAVEREGLEAGAADVLDKTELNSSLLERVIGHAMEQADRLRALKQLRTDSAHRLQEQEKSFQAEKDRLERKLAEARHAGKQLEHQLVKALQLVARAVETRIPYTSGHQQHIAQLASAIAAKMGLESKTADRVYLAGLVHDLGNIDLPPEILSRPGKLSPAEYNVVRTHSKLGHDILRDLEFAAPLAGIVRQHHERLDGSGYPDHLKGTDILLEARVLAVAEVVGSMISDRPHRKAHSLHRALNELTRGRGALFDPEAVDACVGVCEEKYAG